MWKQVYLDNLRHKVGSVDRATEVVTSEVKDIGDLKRGGKTIFLTGLSIICTQYYNTCLGPDLENIRTLMCTTIDLKNYFEKIPQKRYCAALLFNYY